MKTSITYVAPWLAAAAISGAVALAPIANAAATHYAPPANVGTPPAPVLGTGTDPLVPYGTDPAPHTGWATSTRTTTKATSQTAKWTCLSDTPRS